jgi:hypothetical protein
MIGNTSIALPTKLFCPLPLLTTVKKDGTSAPNFFKYDYLRKFLTGKGSNIKTNKLSSLHLDTFKKVARITDEKVITWRTFSFLSQFSNFSP